MIVIFSSLFLSFAKLRFVEETDRKSGAGSLVG